MKPRSVVSAAILAVTIVLLIVGVYILSTLPGSVTSPLPSKFTAGGKTFPITSIASTEMEREHGLMNAKITNTTIELFAWPTSGYYQFWMYQTNSSLDMIWISATNSTGRIVYVVQGAPPCFDSGSCAVYTPTAAANYVIEAKAGFVPRNNLTVGTVLTFG